MASKVVKEAEEKQVNRNDYENGKEISENEEMNSYLLNLYYDLRSPVSFSGFYELYNKIKKD